MLNSNLTQGLTSTPDTSFSALSRPWPRTCRGMGVANPVHDRPVATSPDGIPARAEAEGVAATRPEREGGENVALPRLPEMELRVRDSRRICSDDFE